MDEIESFKIIKKLIKIFIILIFSIILIFFIEKILNGNIILGRILDFIINFLGIIALWIFMIVFPVIVYMCINKIRSWINLKANGFKNVEYIRDI